MTSATLESGKNRRGLKIGLVLIISIIGGYYAWLFLLSGDFFISHSNNESDRQELLRIRNDLSLGDGYEKVLQNIWAKKACSRLRLNAHSAEEWSITMTPETFATDWQMYIKFKEHKVAGFKIRTSDGPKPSHAPEDIGNIDE
jgi:hypothetical protein